MTAQQIGPRREVELTKAGERSFLQLDDKMPKTLRSALREFQVDAAQGLRAAVELDGGSFYWCGHHRTTRKIGFFFEVTADRAVIVRTVSTGSLQELPRQVRSA